MHRQRKALLQQFDDSLKHNSIRNNSQLMISLLNKNNKEVIIKDILLTPSYPCSNGLGS